MNEIDIDIHSQWLSQDELETVRGRVPIVYVEAVPVRLDELGEVTHIG